MSHVEPKGAKDESQSPTARTAGAAAMVHLITILYQSEAGISAFLDSLQAQDMPEWRLHAIDNATPDGSADLVAERADPRITLHRNAANLGFAKAANQGLREAAAAGGEFLVLINNDTAFEPDFLRHLVGVRAEHGAGVIAPRIMRRDQPDAAWYAGGHLAHGWVFENRHEICPDANPDPVTVDFAPGCCLGIARSVLEQVGLFDESFFVYWEDTDFCLRLKQQGIPILYVPEPNLEHDGGAASGGEFSPAYIRLYFRSYMQVLRKHFGFQHALVTMLRLLSREIGRSSRDSRKVRAMANAMLHGLAAPMVAEARLGI